MHSNVYCLKNLEKKNKFFFSFVQMNVCMYMLYVSYVYIVNLKRNDDKIFKKLNLFVFNIQKEVENSQQRKKKTKNQKKCVCVRKRFLECGMFTHKMWVIYSFITYT